MVDITGVCTFVAAFISEQFSTHSCDFKQAETCSEMKQTLGVLPHRGPLDTYWEGLTCLDLGKWRDEGSGRGKSSEGVSRREIAHKEHNRQIWTVTRERDRSDRYDYTKYVGKQTRRRTVMELFGGFLRQTYKALYFPDAQRWPSFVCADSHCRAKKQTPPRTWISHSLIRQVLPF